MACYRIYEMDVRGKIVSRQDQQCADDAAALAFAATIATWGMQAQVWLGTRLVGKASLEPLAFMSQAGLVAGRSIHGAPLH